MKKTKLIKRPLRLFTDNKGKKYVMIKGKRMYIKTELDGNRLIQVIVNNTSSEKIRRRRGKPKIVNKRAMSDAVIGVNHTQAAIIGALNRSNDKSESLLLKSQLDTVTQGLNLLKGKQAIKLLEAPKKDDLKLLEAPKKDDVKLLEGPKKGDVKLIGGPKSTVTIEDVPDLAFDKSVKKKIGAPVLKKKIEGGPKKSSLEEDSFDLEKEYQVQKDFIDAGIKQYAQLEFDHKKNIKKFGDEEKSLKDSIKFLKHELDKDKYENDNNKKEKAKLEKQIKDLNDEYKKVKESLKKEKEEYDDLLEYTALQRHKKEELEKLNQGKNNAILSDLKVSLKKKKEIAEILGVPEKIDGKDRKLIDIIDSATNLKPKTIKKIKESLASNTKIDKDTVDKLKDLILKDIDVSDDSIFEEKGKKEVNRNNFDPNNNNDFKPLIVFDDDEELDKIKNEFTKKVENSNNIEEDKTVISDEFLKAVNDYNFRKQMGYIIGNVGNGSDKGGLYDSEINQIMRPYFRLGFKGCIPIDRISKIRIIPSEMKNRISFIMNTGVANSKGKHWIAVVFDFQDRSLLYYDSLAEQPTKMFLYQIKMLIDKMKLPYYLKMKINKIQSQSNVSDNCGWFAIKFIMDIYNEKEYKFCTGYMDIKKGEKSIEPLKHKFGYI